MSRIKFRKPNRTYGLPDNFLLGIMAMQYTLFLAITLPFMPFTYDGFWTQLGIVLLSGLAVPLFTYALYGPKFTR